MTQLLIAFESVKLQVKCLLLYKFTIYLIQCSVNPCIGNFYMGENYTFSVAARGDEKGGYRHSLALASGLTCLKAGRFIVCSSPRY